MFSLNLDYNHGRDYYKMMGTMTRMVVYSPDVTWHQAREPLILPAWTPEAVTGNLAPTSEYVCMSPPATVATPITTTPPNQLLPHHYMNLSLVPSSTSAATPTPAPAPTATPALSMPPPPTPIYDSVVRKLGLERDLPMPRCTRG